MKGGDFMEREDGPKGPRESVPDVHVDGRVPSTSEDPFPKVVGRTRADGLQEFISDPVKRAMEEMVMATGRE